MKSWHHFNEFSERTETCAWYYSMARKLFEKGKLDKAIQWQKMAAQASRMVRHLYF